MYRYIHILGLATLLFFGSYAYVFAEEIEAYTISLEVKESGTVEVVEEIVYDFGAEERHGIFRDIPHVHPQPARAWYTKRKIVYEDIEVLLDGATVPFDVFNYSDTVSIKIGDPNSIVTGVHTYTISYTLVGALSYFDTGATELYWNAVGTGWQVPIRNVRVTVGPTALFADDRACYQGTGAATFPCDGMEVTATSAVFFATQLMPFEGLTVAQALNPDNVAVLVYEEMTTWYFWVFGLVAWIIGIAWFGYVYRTRHKTGRSIIPQYEPYEDFKPMFTGVLFDGRLDHRDITAGIVYLAERGFLKIQKTEQKVLFFFTVDDYEVTLLRPVADAETSFQKEVLTLLFDLYAAVGARVRLSELQKNLRKQTENRKKLHEMKKAIEQDLEAHGFFQRTVFRYSAIAAPFLVFLVFLLGEFFAQFIPVPLLIVSGVVLASIAVLSVFLMRRRTRKGYIALDHLKGFKQFLSVTDKERFAFHNAPEKSPEQFMEYLPYAIAFGVEEKWAHVFEGITIPDPDWYEGNAGGHFSATNLTTSLNAFATAFAVSSGSGGSGGSGGGGSVGGGGGGGGGGSW